MSDPEKILIEDTFIDKLVASGWTFVPGKDLERDDFREPLLIPNLIKSIKKINKDVELEETEIWQVIRELQMKGMGIEDSRKILQFYKNGIPIRTEKGKEIRYIRLFDYENVKENEPIVSRQVYNKGIDEKDDDPRRNDIILYINGIPIVNIECKNPLSISEDWTTAYTQIKDYEKSIPELYKYVQIGVAAEMVVKYFPIVPWQEDVRVEEWKNRDAEEETLRTHETAINEAVLMLNPETLLDIMRNFLIFRSEFGNHTKVLPRYMQYRAANKIVKRVIENLKGNTNKKRGLIWHWQGSGKTLEIIFAANKLYHLGVLSNPSIFFIVDRLDLEDQLYTEYNALDLEKPEIISSIDELRSILMHDSGRGKRGLMITLIHKFNPDELRQLQKDFEAKTTETIMDRENVIVFIDEGHRSQYGTLASQMQSILKKAFFFAFTGTPVKRKGKKSTDTYTEFAYPDDEEIYLDRYFIRESVEDGFTTKIAHQQRLEKEGGIQLEKEMLEQFLDTELEEIPEDDRQEVEEGVKKRLNTINLFLENPKRIEKVAEDIAQHFTNNVDGKFKAMVVAASRPACVTYKTELDKQLPPEYSEIVMTYNKNKDPKSVKEYAATLIERYGMKDLEGINKTIRDNFKEEELPKILIVTDKLLTGFDAPILQTEYLDKPLREHRLLQAIARTNRPYKDVKEVGLIVDYVGIFSNLKKALELYNETDIEGVAYNMDEMREEFHKLIEELLEMFEGTKVGVFETESIIDAIKILTADEAKTEKFIEDYIKLRKLFEFLGTEEIKLEWLNEYKWLTGIYTYYMKMVRGKYVGDIKKYFDKTVKYVHESTEVQAIENSFPTIEFDENYLEKLEKKVTDPKEKAANIVFTLNRFVLVEKANSPVFEPIVDRVVRLLDLWKHRSDDYTLIYQEGAETFREMIKLSEMKKQEGLSDLEYSMLMKIKQNDGDDENLSDAIKKLSKELQENMFEGWMLQDRAKKKVEQILRKFAIIYGKSRQKSVEEIDELYNKLEESVKQHAQ